MAVSLPGRTPGSRKAWLNPIPSIDTSSPWRFLASTFMPHKGSREALIGPGKDRVNRGPGGAPPVAPVTSTHALNAGAPRVPQRLPNLRDVVPSKETGQRTFQELVDILPTGRRQRRRQAGAASPVPLAEVPVDTTLEVPQPSWFGYAAGAGTLVLAIVVTYFVARRKPR